MTLGLRPSPVARRTPFLFDWDGIAGWTRLNQPVTVDGVLGTFARAGKKTAVDCNGRVYTVPYGVPAHYHLYSAALSTWVPVGPLLERAGTNLVTSSEDHTGTGWSAIGTPTRVANARRCGAVTLELIGDDAAGTLEGYSQTVAFTGDGTKGYTVFISQGSSASSVLRVRDTDASADRLLCVITWSAGAPVLTFTAGAAILTVGERLQDADGNRVYRLWLAPTGVVAANTNVLQVYPATDSALAVTGTGTLYIGGHMAENDATAALRPSSYIPTTTLAASRVIDSLTFPWLRTPVDMTAYLDVVGFGSFSAPNLRTLQIGDDDSGTASSAIITCPAAGDVRLYYENASANVNSDNTTGAVNFQERQELRAALLAAGIYIGRSIAGAAEVVSTPAAAQSHPATFAENIISLTPNGFSAHAVKRLRLGYGERTLAQLQVGL